MTSTRTRQAIETLGSMMNDTPLLATRKEAGTTLRCGLTTIDTLIRSGKLHSVKIGRSRRIPVSALREYVEQLQQENA